MRKKIFIVLTVLWMALIFYLSNQPASVSTEQSNSAITILSNIPLLGNIIDNMISNGTATVIIRKSAHMLSYALLSILFFMSIYDFYIDLRKTCLKSIFITFIYACTDELHQLFVPGRSGEFKDVLIDSTGAIIAVVIMYFIIRKINRK